MGRTDEVQFMLECVAEWRRLGARVTFEPGWESRGNGLQGNYEGGIVHHTASNSSATKPNPTRNILINGRPDLTGPLCNVTGPWCTDNDPWLHVIAAYPANHAGASGGKSMGPLPVTGLFNPRVVGLEIDYAGTTPMTGGQRKAALIFTRGLTNVLKRSTEYVRAHAETSVTGKWDAGQAPGKTIDMAAFRRDAANFATTTPAPLIEDDDMKIIQSTNRGIALVGPNYYRGLTSNEEVEQAVNLWGSPVIGNDRQFDLWVSMATGGESADSKEIVGFGHRVESTEAAVTALAASVASRPATSGSVGAGQAIDIKELAAEIVALQNQQARDGNPATGPVS